MLLGSTGLENHPDGTGNINALVNGNWGVLDETFNPASGILSSQSGTTVTSAKSIFTADDVGATIRWQNGQTAIITAYTSATVVTVGVSQTVTSQFWALYRADVVQTPITLIARGMFKRPRIPSSYDGGYVVWSDSLQRFVITPSAQATLGSFATIGNSGTVTLDFAGALTQFTGVLTGNITFTSANLTPGAQINLIIYQRTSTPAFTITFPTGWKLAGTNVVASTKRGIFQITSCGTTDADVSLVGNATN